MTSPDAIFPPDFFAGIGVHIDPDMPDKERKEVMALMQAMGVTQIEDLSPEPDVNESLNYSLEGLASMLERFVPGEMAIPFSLADHDEENFEEIALAAAEIALAGTSEKIGYFRASGATVLWSSRGGNFVEIAVAHLGKGDVFDLTTGVIAAARRMVSGSFILVPCDEKMPGHRPRDVAERLFNRATLSGDEVVSQKIQRSYETAVTAAIAKVGAEFEQKMQDERTRRGV